MQKLLRYNKNGWEKLHISEKYCSQNPELTLDIEKALSLLKTWDIYLKIWTQEAVKKYVETEMIIDLEKVADPKANPINYCMGLGCANINYEYIDQIDSEKQHTPGIVIPKGIYGFGKDTVIDGNHRLLKRYKGGLGITLYVLSEKEVGEIII